VKYLPVVLLWILWCVLHSFLIATTVTDYLKNKLGDGYRFYRLFYNVAALVTVLPLTYYSVSVDLAPIFHWQGSFAVAKYFLLATSLYLFIAGARHYNMSQFLGVRQIKTGETNSTLSKCDAFDTTGILSAIRHPWYLAGIMIVWTRDISLPALLNNIVITTYFVIGAILEERKLVREFGEKYEEYQKRVSMFLPYRWLKTKIAGHSI
jgi:protein-S-isoprenylcysteine O-methyltransferase Ste14